MLRLAQERLYTLLGAVCLAELATMFPQAGGYYVYARRTFGDFVGFAVGWTDWVTYCAVLGYVFGLPYFYAWLIEFTSSDQTAVYQLRQAEYIDEFVTWTVSFGARPSMM